MLKQPDFSRAVQIHHSAYTPTENGYIVFDAGLYGDTSADYSAFHLTYWNGVGVWLGNRSDLIPITAGTTFVTDANFANIFVPYVR